MPPGEDADAFYYCGRDLLSGLQTAISDRMKFSILNLLRI
uniref:Uncharacterized protein n=1 Tax=Anguilla anguilla TaxID=7936 RepID=A0A0E9VFF4_ANGAN